MKINGITGYLWRAVDQHGNVLDVLVGEGDLALLAPGEQVVIDELGAVEFSTDVKCCDETGVGFMLVVERAVPRSARRLLTWPARSARFVVDAGGG